MPAMRHRRGPALAAAFVIAAAVFAAIGIAVPLRSLASTPGCACDPPSVVPESPLGASLLVVAAMLCVGLVVLMRRHRGISAAVVPTLTVVLLLGVVIGSAVAAADTACTCNPVVGGVLGVATGPASGDPVANTVTPYTGADIPWLTAAIIIVGGSLATLIARPRRRGTSAN